MGFVLARVVQQVPEDLRFDNLQVPQFVNEDRSVKIAKGTEVRLKVQSVTYIGKELVGACLLSSLRTQRGSFFLSLSLSLCVCLSLCA